VKTHNGFISNSSSTSFVIAVKETKPCKCCGSTPMDLVQILLLDRQTKDVHYQNLKVEDVLPIETDELNNLEQQLSDIDKETKELEKLCEEKDISGVLNSIVRISVILQNYNLKHVFGDVKTNLSFEHFSNYKNILKNRAISIQNVIKIKKELIEKLKNKEIQDYNVVSLTLDDCDAKEGILRTLLEKPTTIVLMEEKN